MHAIELPYNHRQKYAIQHLSSLPAYSLRGLQVGSGVGSSLSKALSTAASIAGKVASNKGVQQLAKTGLEVGATVAGNALANKVMQNEQLANVAQHVAPVIASLQDQRDSIKKMYIDGQIDKNQAKKLLTDLYKQHGSGAVRALNKTAMKQYQRGAVMDDIPAFKHNQRGGIAPAVIAGAAATVGLPLIAAMLAPIIEKVSQKHIVNKIPGLGDE